MECLNCVYLIKTLLQCIKFLLLSLILVCEPPDELFKGLQPVPGLLLGAAGRGWRWLGHCLLPHTLSFQLSQPPGMETIQVRIFTKYIHYFCCHIFE